MGRFEQKVNQEDVNHANQYLSFKLFGQTYAISIENVIEIVRVAEITPLPEQPLYMKGVVDLRGRIIPIIDLGLRIGTDEIIQAERTCVIIISINGAYIGLLVDEVRAVFDVTADQIIPPPNFAAEVEISKQFLMGIGQMDSELALIINSSAIASDMELTELQGWSAQPGQNNSQEQTLDMQN